MEDVILIMESKKMNHEKVLDYSTGTSLVLNEEKMKKINFSSC